MLKDYPELHKVFRALEAEKAAIKAQSQPLRDEYERLHAEATPLEVRMRELAAQFNAIERPRLAEIDNQLGALARATGGYVMSRGSTPPSEPGA